ncbi:MAG: cell division protein FtsQ [Lachnospiraceae bacterium]|nr:cell division protein FtsQ [Lachnospiraceae bacterium]
MDAKELKYLYRGVLILFGMALLLGGYLYLRIHFEVQDVTVNGSTHYSKEEIKGFAMGGEQGNNTLYLYLKYRFRGRSITGIPFIERMDVNVEPPHKVTIDVYEKAIAGYVGFLDRYMYFDREGIIVESSLDPSPEIPYVTGLEFRECVLNEPLPVKNPKVFEEILSITQLLTKHGIHTDCIYFAHDGRITLYFGDARVAIGTTDSIDEKMMRLKYIVPELAGRRGILHMENYSEENEDSYITFEAE